MKKLSSALFVLSVMGGMFFAIHGLIHLNWPSALPWSGSGALFRFLITLCFIFCAIFMISWWTRNSCYAIAALLLLVFSLLSGNLWPLFTVLWIFLSSYLLGKMILSFLNEATCADNFIVHILVGLGFYGTIIGLLAHFPVGYPGVYYCLLLFPVLLKYRMCKELFRAMYELALAKRDFGIVELLLNALITAVGLIYVLVSFMPEVGFDSLAMHLFIPVQIYSKHKWSFDVVTYVWATTPMLGDWLFSLSYMIAGEFGARLLLVGFIFIIAGLIRQFCLWAGGDQIGIRWAVLIYLSTPLTFALGSTLFIDVLWTAFLIAGFFMFFKFCFSNTLAGSSLYSASLLLGYAAESKAVTLSLLPILVLLMAVKIKSWSRAADVKKILLALSLFLLMGCSPYITAWIYTGNPVFPFFNAIFKSEYYPLVNFDSAAVFGRGISWNTLYLTVFESGKYFEAGPGASGFQWLILLIPVFIALILKGEKKGLFIASTGVLIVILVFQSVSYLRYAFPAWIMLSIAVGVALSSKFIYFAFISKILMLSCGIAVGMNLLFFTAGSFYRDFSLKSIFDRSIGGSYIASRLPMRKAVLIANELNIASRPVAVFGSPLAAGLMSDALYPNWYNNRFQSAINFSKSSQDIANVLIDNGVEYIILEANWNGAGCCGPEKQKMIEDATVKISDLGLISVRKLSEEFYFRKELLVNPELKGGLGWNVAPGVGYDKSNGALIVDINSSASQAIGVTPGIKYRNSVVARCFQAMGTGRVQVNWLDKDGRFIDASIKTFECTREWAEHSMDVIAPKGAKTGVVYVVGHSSIPLEYQRSSFKQ